MKYERHQHDIPMGFGVVIRGDLVLYDEYMMFNVWLVKGTATILVHTTGETTQVYPVSELPRQTLGWALSMANVLTVNVVNADPEIRKQVHQSLDENVLI